MNALERLLRCVLRHRLLAILALLALTLLAARESALLKVDNGLDAWFLQDDPALLEYQDYQRTFGDDEVLVVAVERAEGFRDGPGIHELEKYSSAIAALDGVASLQSAAAVNDPELARHLLSGDGRVALMFARLRQAPETDGRRPAILDQVDLALARPGTAVHTAGVGVIYEALNEASIDNALALLIASALLVTLTLWMFTANARVVIASMCSVVVAVAWTMGLYTVTGHALNMMTMILPSLVLVVGIATCVHIFVHCSDAADSGPARADRLAPLFFIIRPCLASALTSAAGFAALNASRIPVIQELGQFSAAGALLAVAVSILVCALAGPREIRSRARPTAKAQLDRLVAGMVGLAMAAPRRVVAGFLVLFLVASAGIARVEVDTFTLDYLFPDHPVHRDSDFIEQRVGPYTALDFIVHSDTAGILRPDVVAALAEWQEAADRSGAARWSVPAAGKLASAVVRPPEASSASGVVTSDGRSLRVTFGVYMQSARSLQRTIEALSELADFPAGVQVNAAGYLPLYTKIVSHVVESQLASMGISFLLAFLVIGAMLRSVKLTTLALLVNLLPLLVMLGFMGFAGIPIDVATVTTSAVILGLMVDEAVHIIYRLQTDGAAGGLRRVMEASGPPLAMTTALVIIGFAVLTLAEVRPIVWIGLLVPIGAGMAFAADLMLLPALLVLRGSTAMSRQPAPEPAAGAS